MGKTSKNSRSNTPSQSKTSSKGTSSIKKSKGKASASSKTKKVNPATIVKTITLFKDQKDYFKMNAKYEKW